MQAGPGWEPVVTRPDLESEQEREAWLDHVAGLDEPPNPEAGCPARSRHCATAS